MSIWTSLYTGSSGLIAHGKAIGVVGDNIANVSTVGFRASRARFSDILGDTAANGQRVGAGVRLGGVDTVTSQGSLLQTGASLDFAVRGNGMFVVNGNHGGIDGNYYTRDGRFNLDKAGYMVNPQGLRLQGYVLDSNGVVSPALSDLELGGQSPANPTTSVTMSTNLDASELSPAAWDPTDPNATSNFATSMTVYDSLGAAHRMDIYFRNQGGGSWEWHAMVDGAELTGGTPGVMDEVASGTLTFTPNGELDTETIISSSANFLNAEPGQVIDFDFGDAITTDGGTGLNGSTQFVGASSVNGIDQDGYSAGELVDVLVSEDGTVRGLFSNGQSRDVAKVALATFPNTQGLTRAGDQLYVESGPSGQALIGEAGTGSRGAISSGALEGSNVDLSNELVTLIAYQRAFQANARTITTADEMLAEISNLKR